MTKITHSLKFVTELDEAHPTAKQLLELPEQMQVMFLEGLLKELLAPALAPALEEANKGNSWAVLKVAE